MCVTEMKLAQAKWKIMGRLIMLRCKFFKPIGNEELCPNHMCACWPHNNRYHQDLNQVKELIEQISNFWSDKLSKVK